MKKIIVVLLSVIYFIGPQLNAQTQPSQSSAKEMMTLEQFKKNREKFKKALAEKKATQERINKIGGDRAKIFKVCPHPKGWRPEKASIDKAIEWDVVPSYVNSKTYPRRKGGHTMFEVLPSSKDGKKIDEQLSKSECDYVTIHFQNNMINRIDRSRCEVLQIQAESFAECRKLLGFN